MNTTMFPTGSIVVGVDGSPTSTLAVDWAAREAVLQRRPLALLHAYHVDHVYAMGIYPSEVRDELADEGKTLLDVEDERLRETFPEIEIHRWLGYADPREALIEASSTAALVVVGSRGLGRLGSLLLGSVGVAVVRHAACPVVVRRPGDSSGHGVVVGYDADEGDAALLTAWQFASERHVPVTVVLSERYYSPYLEPGDHEALDQKERAALHEAMAALSEKFPDVHAIERTIGKPLASALIDLAPDYELVVVGSHPHGSLAVAVVEHASAAVVVVPRT
jgi:nucleotide-binding universal stress UspA family protein